MRPEEITAAEIVAGLIYAAGLICSVFLLAIRLA